MGSSGRLFWVVAVTAHIAVSAVGSGRAQRRAHPRAPLLATSSSQVCVVGGRVVCQGTDRHETGVLMSSRAHSVLAGDGVTCEARDERLVCDLQDALGRMQRSVVVDTREFRSVALSAAGLCGRARDWSCVSFVRPGAMAWVEGRLTRRHLGLALSDSQACATRDSRTVECWGPVGPDTRVRLDGAVRSLAVGERHACAVLQDDRVFCWGANDLGQRGSGRGAAGAGATVVRGLRARVLASGDDHVCALARSGRVACWGANGVPQDSSGEGVSVLPCGTAGAGDDTSVVWRPTEVVGVSGANAIAAARYRTCAINGNRDVVCWGVSVVPRPACDFRPQVLIEARGWTP